MTEGVKEMILTIYDEGISKNKAIQTICKMYGFTREEVLEVLKEGNREIPYERKPVPPRSKEAEEIRAAADDVAKAAAGQQLPVANYIYEVLAEKMDELDKQIREIEEKRQQLMARYQTISMFIKENNL